MKTFPMFLKMAGRRVVIFGGGEQAAQKTRLMLKTEAEIVVVAAELEPELAGLASGGRIRHWTKVTPDLFENTALVFVATGDRATDEPLAALARAAGVVTNVVDAPDLCDAFTPSIVDRDPLVVAIGTEGAAPSSAARSGRTWRPCSNPGWAISWPSPAACATRWPSGSRPPAAAPSGPGPSPARRAGPMRAAPSARRRAC